MPNRRHQQHTKPDMEAFETWWKEHFRLYNVRVEYAKIEAILSTALASVQADSQKLPYLDYVGEDGICWWGAWKDACYKLWELGADMHVIRKLYNLSVADPVQRRVTTMAASSERGSGRIPRTSEWLRALQGTIKALEQLTDDPSFAYMSPDFQDFAHAEMGFRRRQFSRVNIPRSEAYNRAQIEDPLLPILDQDAPAGHTVKGIATTIMPLLDQTPRKGRPPSERATLAMVVLTDHLRKRTGKPYWKEVGQFALALFPGCINEQPRLGTTRRRPPAKRLAEIVEDRCKDFKRRHARALPRLQEAVMDL